MNFESKYHSVTISILPDLGKLAFVMGVLLRSNQNFTHYEFM